jgi:phenylalanyl-tRNA synthetase beta chain
LAIALAGQRNPFDRFNPRPQIGDQLDYFDAKGMVDTLLEQFGVLDVTWDAFTHPSLHPGRSAEIRAGDERIGIVAELLPTLAKALDIDGVRVAVAELNLQRVVEIAASAPRRDVKVARYLPVEQDFAVVVSRTIPASTVQRALEQNAGPLMTGITLFDVYEGEQIGEGNKSLAYRLTFTAPDRALTDAELGKVRKRIERGVRSALDGALRA